MSHRCVQVGYVETFPSFKISIKEFIMNIIDLHVHSTKSDGTLTPTELVNYAIEKGLSAFALTDHDTTEGIGEALEAANKHNNAIANGEIVGLPLEVIPGIEFSTEYMGKDIHILGLYIDYNSFAFKEKIQEFVDSRILRNQKMCASLASDGIDITYEKLLEENPDAVITRSHYAKYLLNHGYTTSMKEAFERYIGDHCKHFIPREKITPMQAVGLINEVGGLAFLAHPTLYRMSDRVLEGLIKELKDSGLAGIEAVYSTYTQGEETQMRKFASKYDLLISGGSDFHGTVKPKLDLAVGYGKLFIPESILSDIKSSLNQNSMNTKIFFADLDGTLLNKQKQITPLTYQTLKDWTDKEEVSAYLMKILKKEAFDKSGLIYGMGHAVYTISDPRAVLLKRNAKRLALEKNAMAEFELYNLVEELSPGLFCQYKGVTRPICANVDLYSGFVYSMLNISEDLYTPLFAMARIVGWCAHHIEEITYGGKIIRPAYKSVAKKVQYTSITER